MVRLNDISIRSKLIIMQVFTSLLVLGMFASIYILTDINFYKARKEENMKSLARVTGINSLSSLQFDDDEEASKVLAALQNNTPDIVYAVILDARDSVFASYIRPGINISFIPDLATVHDVRSTDSSLAVSYTITDKNKKAGKIILEIELSELRALTKSKFKIFGYLLPVALGFSFLVAWLVQYYISRRLLDVVNTMKTVSETGDYSQSIKDDGKDEISVLSKVFNNLLEQVKENQQRKDEFIGIASHELKTPLTTIKGYVELLHMMEERDPNKQFVQKALENTNKLERLVKDLLDVSNIQSGQLKLNREPFDIDILLHDTVSAFQMTTKTHMVTMENSQKQTMVLADKRRIEQVLLNLLSNAVKYSPEENSIIVAATQKNDQLVIKIRDFGVGIAEDERESIFNRFYRTKDVSKHIVGFGLGLYICRDIIQRHLGKIWVERETKGSAFYFSLPINHLPDMDTVS